MSREEDSYKPGEEAFYHGFGTVDKVEVLENNSDTEWIKYKLRILANVKSSIFLKPSEIGEEFVFKKGRNVSGGGLSYLMDH